MSEPIQWDSIRVTNLHDAIRQACLLEATAPKAGNVHPGASFSDLCYNDFVVAANITADELVKSDSTIAHRMRSAVMRTRQATGTNVNLGIVLLLGPLVDCNIWEEGDVIFDCIRLAGAGGLSRVNEMDVNECRGDVDLLAAMQAAASRDDIAKQYATGFRDLHGNVVPLVSQHLLYSDDTLGGIVQAHLHLLSTRIDSLIARKNGVQVATDVKLRAANALAGDDHDRREFDAFLRDQSHRLNPGTTADLIAASLFVLLRNKIEKS